MPIQTVAQSGEATTAACQKVSDIAPPKGFLREEKTGFGLFLRNAALGIGQTILMGIDD